MPAIHPTAIIDPRATLADDVRIDPYVVIQGRVEIGPRCHIQSHSIIHGHTIIGANCKIGPAAHVGFDPQHLKFDGTETSLIIGDDVVIREGASLHCSMKPGEENATRVGNKCFIMGGSHVGHDCRVGESVILANNTLLAGHVTVGDGVFLGGGCGVHQFCRIGRLAMIAGGESISRDIPPFSAVRYGGLKGYNAIGCRRAGMSQAAIHALRRAYHILHSKRTTPAGVKAIEASADAGIPEVRELLTFIATAKRGVQPSVRWLAAMVQSGNESEKE